MPTAPLTIPPQTQGFSPPDAPPSARRGTPERHAASLVILRSLDHKYSVELSNRALDLKPFPQHVHARDLQAAEFGEAQSAVGKHHHHQSLATRTLGQPLHFHTGEVAALGKVLFRPVHRRTWIDRNTPGSHHIVEYMGQYPEVLPNGPTRNAAFNLSSDPLLNLVMREIRKTHIPESGLNVLGTIDL